MLSKRTTLYIFVLSFLAATGPMAQAETTVPSGGLKFNVIDTDAYKINQDTAKLPSTNQIHRFLDLEKMFNQDIFHLNIPEEKIWDDSTRLVADYYFGSGEVVPLVGISMGYIQKENDTNQIVARPKIGLKYFMNPNAYLFGLLEYQLLFEDTDKFYDIYNQGQFVYGIGLGLTFSY